MCVLGVRMFCQVRSQVDATEGHREQRHVSYKQLVDIVVFCGFWREIHLSATSAVLNCGATSSKLTSFSSFLVRGSPVSSLPGGNRV